MKPDGTSTGLAESFGYALSGLARASRGRNFRIQAGIGLVAVLLGVAFRITIGEWAAVVICIGMVLGAECFNSALEDTLDALGSGYDKHIGRAKDAAAAGVLCASVASLVVGVTLFLPRIVGAVV